MLKNNTNCELTKNSDSANYRKVCRLCAKFKPVDFLFPFYGTEYEQIIDNCHPFGLFIERDDGLPTEICQTCSKMLLKFKQTIEKFIEADKKLKLLKPTVKVIGDNETHNLTKDIKPVNLEPNEVILEEIKQETPISINEELETEIDIENENQIALGDSLMTEVKVTNEIAKIFLPGTDSMKEECEEFRELNNSEDLRVKDEPNDNEMIETEEAIQESGKIDDSTTIKEAEKSNNLIACVEKTDSDDGHLQSGISWIELFECCNCKKRYITKNAVISHVTIDHAEDQMTHHSKFQMIRVKINSKSKIISTEELSKQVLSTQNKTEKVFTCNICGLTLKQNKLLEDHLMAHKRDLNDEVSGIYKCHFCKKKTQSEHLQKGNMLPFACEKCYKKFNKNGKLYFHHRVNNDQSLNCKICNKTFRSKQILKHHVTHVHMKQRKYECSSCKKQFKYLSALKYHMKNLECKMTSAH